MQYASNGYSYMTETARESNIDVVGKTNKTTITTTMVLSSTKVIEHKSTPYSWSEPDFYMQGYW